MGNFDFEAGKRLRKEGDLLEALRCLMGALEQDRDAVEIYIELARTYVLAFDETGDPLCLDSARKVCIRGLRRDPRGEERRILFALKDRVEELLVESQKAEVDAMADALGDPTVNTGPIVPDDAPADGLLDEIQERSGEKPDSERGH